MEHFILEYGIIATAIILFIDDFGIPLPGSIILFSSSILARANPEISLLSLFLVAFLIPPISNGCLFFLGRHGARGWLHRHGHRIYLTEERIKKAESFFQKYGDKAVFIVAMMTSIRPVTSVVAGSMNMSPRRFFLFHLAGIFLWATIIVGSGYLLGEHLWRIVKGYMGIIFLSILLFFVIKFAVEYFRKK